MTTYTIHASKDGKSVQTMLRISPTVTVAKARSLLKLGWQVHVIDSNGQQYDPDKFNQVLSFDRKPPPIKF